MKGWRTLLVNGAIAAFEGAATYFTGNGILVPLLGPTWSVVAVAGLNALLRTITTGPVGTGR